MSMTNLRRAFRLLCARAGLGVDWTIYELRHSFVSLVADQLDDLVSGRPRRPRRHPEALIAGNPGRPHSPITE